MGFKCPVCHKDFGKDKVKLKEHFDLSEKCKHMKNAFMELFDKALNNVRNGGGENVL